MDLTVKIPDILARQMHLDGPDAKRLTLIKLALESYRVGELSRGQVSELLDLSFSETAELLKKNGCGIGSGATFEEYEREYQEAQSILKR